MKHFRAIVFTLTCIAIVVAIIADPVAKAESKRQEWILERVTTGWNADSAKVNLKGEPVFFSCSSSSNCFVLERVNQ